MGVELNINGKEIELSENTRFQFNYTVSDLFNIGSVAVSYSNVVEAPLTPNNTITMGGLGLVGSSSKIPYQKIKAVVKYDGFDIIPDGLIKVEDTGKNYRLGIQDGVVDFFKDIENKTIGNDLDISELSHQKTMENVLRSIDSNRLYRYVVANFGGRTNLPNGVINIDYLIPVVKVSYFWNKIFETFGYTYSGSIFSNPDFVDAYITYPNAPADINVNEVLVSRSFKGNTLDSSPVQIGQSGAYAFPNSYNWDYSGPGFQGWNFVAPNTQAYRLRFRPAGYIQYGSTDTTIYYFNVYSGTNLIASYRSQFGTIDFSNYYLDLNMVAGQQLNFTIVSPSFGTPTRLRIASLEVEVYELSTDNVDFTEAFLDFAIKDYVKEIIWRFGLTPIFDSRTKNIEFITVDEKINFNNYVDWSGKYVKREKESYLYGSYGQSNIFAHKYNDEGDSFNNGNLSISNANLEPSKTIVSSKIYSAEQITRPIGNQNKRTNVYPIWRGEVNESSAGIEVNYKGLNGRYYIMKLSQVNESISFKSEILDNNPETLSYYYVPNADNTHYNELVLKYYPTYQRILNNFKMHEIELALSLPDILQLDFRKLYYFEQEASFYILNKLTWEEGKTTKGEFIKVNK